MRAACGHHGGGQREVPMQDRNQKTKKSKSCSAIFAELARFLPRRRRSNTYDGRHHRAPIAEPLHIRESLSLSLLYFLKNAGPKSKNQKIQEIHVLTRSARARGLLILEIRVEVGRFGRGDSRGTFAEEILCGRGLRGRPGCCTTNIQEKQMPGWIRVGRV